MARKFGSLAIVAVLVAVSGGLSPSALSANTANDGVQPQSGVDATATASTYAGLWGDVEGGVAGRPYVTDLSVTVTPADGSAPTTRSFVTAGTVSTPASTTLGDITAVITPYNVCNPAKGEQPQPGKCYSSPNRLGVVIGYVKGSNSVGVNFSNPTSSNGGTLSTPLLDLIKNPANTTVFDVKLNMNKWGEVLRWTWMNGEPIFWNVNPIGADDSVVSMKFKLMTGPSEMCSSAIPVMGCNPSERGSSFAPQKILTTNFVLSLDDTGVDKMFAGSLFASSNADIGSLEALPVGSPTLGLTYGVSGSSELSGAANEATFYAFVSDSSLLNYFGVTQDTLNAPEFAQSETLRVNRADKGTSGATTWTRWTSETNGTSGYFLSVLGVKFDGTVAAQGAVSTLASANKPARFVMGSKTSNSVSVRRSGSRQVLTMSSTTKACQRSECRWVVSQSRSRLGTKTRRLATVATARSSSRAVATVNAPKGSLISALLQVKKGKKWSFVTSRMVIGQ